MKLKAPALEIPAEEPFRNDLLSRGKSAIALTELIRSTDEPLVLCINGSWGEGKSTFLAMWRQLLRNEGIKTLFFNAWENDFADDAFVSLIGDLELGIEELSLDPASKTAVTEHLKKAKKFSAGLLKRAIPTAVKIASAGIVNIDELTDAAFAQYGEKLAEEQIRRYEESKKSVAGFKVQLSELAKRISDSGDEHQGNPLIILIDELDRCRPPYAVRILEAVKHLFSVSGVVFVLAMDRQQLGHSIRSMYGAEMDVDGYLRRFIDIDYNLPTPDKGAFCKAQFIRFGLADYFKTRTGRETQYDRGQFEELFSELFEALSFSLREQERAFTVLSLAIRCTQENYRLYPLLLGALILVKIKNHTLYRGFVSGQRSSKDVLDYIGSSHKGAEFLNSNYGAALEAFLVGCRANRFECKELALPYKKITELPSSSEQERERANRIVQLLNSFDFNDSLGILNYLVTKIDLASDSRV
ncbi:MAG: KAP family NTPase [Rhodocyclaceae bacterium]|nr:KAP family NTPase [Rhodocyclaceae bacterium]